jgi:hypothetical protein
MTKKEIKEKYKIEPIMKETIEEAINQELSNHFFSNISEEKKARYFMEFGAKWQADRMYSNDDVKHLMTIAFEQGFKKADIVEAGLEGKETDTEINWILLKYNKLK